MKEATNIKRARPDGARQVEDASATVSWPTSAWSMARRVRKALRTPLAVLIAAGFVAVSFGAVVRPEGYAVAGVILAAVVIGIVVPGLTVRQLDATLSFTVERGREGQRTVVHLHLRNRGILPAAGLSLEGLDCSPDRATILFVGPFGRKSYSLEFIPPCRGVYPIEPVALVCGAPLGLWFARKTVTVDRKVLAWPAPTAVDSRLARDLREATSRKAWIASDEIDGLRPYRRGDELRMLHHPQSARHDQLIVRERERIGRPEVCIVLDTCLDSYRGSDAGPGGNREAAIRAAAGLCDHLLLEHPAVRVVIEGRAFPVAARSRQQMMDALARISEDQSPAIDDALMSNACRLATQLIVITPRPFSRRGRMAASAIHLVPSAHAIEHRAHERRGTALRAS